MMFLKLRVPFFADFDKKTLKLVAERFVFRIYQPKEVINTYNEDATVLYVVIRGEVGHYYGLKPSQISADANPEGLSMDIMSWGHEGMAQDKKWYFTSMALKKTMLICLDKRDLIEVL